MTNPEQQTYRGACHCGAVRFEAELDLSKGVGRCNCTICMKISQAGVIIKPPAFRLTAGAGFITEYRAGQGPNFRCFCKHCGVHVYGQGDVPEIGGAFVSVNTNCLEGVELSHLKASYLDGRHDNWQAGPRAEQWPLLP